MKVGDLLSIISHLINVIIFIYFAITLLKINALDIIGLSISAFGIFMSLIANIISIIEK
ncbi:MAG: hypothetical protein AABW67_01210 [Nanoarchaeota archaeon]